jgi:phosphoglycolate phosphatase-like HAD superfamily hydrolase
VKRVKDKACLKREDLLELQPRHPFFVGVDSDGCVFDTMDLKQKECFHPLIISRWRLEPVAALLRETAEFVNLRSRWRGQNRFRALLLTFDLLRERPEVSRAHVRIPDLASLRRFVASGVPLGNPELERAARRTADPELAAVLSWSEDVNAAVAAVEHRVRPFHGARDALERISGAADAICVSQTPAAALGEEWRRHGLAGLVAAIAGQELGTKAEHLRLATRGRYGDGRVLMIGDAPGDRETAAECGALFYPILPSREEPSWRRFLDEAWGRFLDGSFAGEYQGGLIAEFDTLLPSTPPWIREGGQP